VEQIGVALNAATPLIKPDAQQRCQIVITTGARPVINGVHMIVVRSRLARSFQIYSRLDRI
jgi:hypothetical protein